MTINSQRMHGILLHGEEQEESSPKHFVAQDPHEPQSSEPRQDHRHRHQQQQHYYKTIESNNSSSDHNHNKNNRSSSSSSKISSYSDDSSRGGDGGGGIDSNSDCNQRIVETKHFLTISTTNERTTTTTTTTASAITSSSHGEDDFSSQYSLQSEETGRLSWTSSSNYSHSNSNTNNNNKDQDSSMQQIHPSTNAVGSLSRSKPSVHSFSSSNYYSSSGSSARGSHYRRHSCCSYIPQHHPEQQQQQQASTTTGSTTTTSSTSNGTTTMRRSNSRSVFSDAEMSHAQSQTLTLTKYFGHDVNRFTHQSPQEPIFDSALRNFIEPHISKARKAREEQRRLILDKMGIDPHTMDTLSIASNAFVPYPGLRTERPFLYDVETYPLHQILADTLRVSDLSLIHEHSIQDKRVLLSPLLDEKKRRAFHQCYDNFVQTFCIPLMHSLAISQKMLVDFSRNPHSQKIYYRYQAFPCLRVIRPNEFSIGPHCDMAYGHSIGNINFHIPLTPTYGTNCVYTESHPGREDWHPLKTKSVGLGYVFDGARCLHFTLENTTPSTRVSLDFRIAIYRDRGGGGGGGAAYGTAATNHELFMPLSSSQAMMQHTIISRSVPREFHSQYSHQHQHQHSQHQHHHTYKRSLSEPDYDDECSVHDCLCHPKILEDNFSIFPGYYEEAFIDMGRDGVGRNALAAGPVVQKKNHILMPPDKRVGFPF